MAHANPDVGAFVAVFYGGLNRGDDRIDCPGTENGMKREVSLSQEKIPQECPCCGKDDLCIDNVEGMECLTCGVWFDTDNEGNVIWVRSNRPMDLGLW